MLHGSQGAWSLGSAKVASVRFSQAKPIALRGGQRNRAGAFLLPVDWIYVEVRPEEHNGSQRQQNACVPLAP